MTTRSAADPHMVCYAVKANSNLAILRLLAEAGAGFDIVSGGELFRVFKAGGDPAKVVFSGVGKTAAEIDQALRAGIFVFNCESEPELALIDAMAHRLRSEGSRGDARESRCRRGDARLYFDRPSGAQIRRRIGAKPRGSTNAPARTRVYCSKA